MNAEDPLREALCELATELQEDNLPLIVGGGYGLILKAEYLLAIQAETLRLLIPLRATQDLGLFLTAEVIADADRTKILREALDHLGYEPVDVAQYYQFSRSVEYLGQWREIKIDLLAQVPKDTGSVSVDDRRIRPLGYRLLHAHTSPEALTIDAYRIELQLDYGENQSTVFLPHPFSYLMLKLFALRDRKDDPEQDMGRHHAFDLYSIVRMMTPDEWDQCPVIRGNYNESPVLAEARRIRGDLFAELVSVGSLRVQESIRTGPHDLSDYPVEEFLGNLRTILGEPDA